MSFFDDVLGSKLLTKSGEQATADVLKGKDYVLVYFSAHWCPPCRGFTPMLAEFYKQNHGAKNFETVFVSLDKNEEQFNEYYGEMPWNAVPFASPKRQAVSGKYCGEGIPDLCIFDAAGNVVRKGAVGKVREDPSGNHFPWPSPKWNDALPEHFITKDGSKVSADALKGKTVGIYCSAHWCPPCRMFTPQLASFYAEYKKLNPNFEIVFCSSDKSGDEMMSYFKEAHGDYLCFEYDSPKRLVMKELVDADGIPTFAIYADGKLVNKGGRAKVGAGAQKVHEEGWEPTVVGDLTNTADVMGVDINSAPAVVVRAEGCDDDTIEEVEKALEVVAREYIAKSETPELICFVSKKVAGITEQLVALTKKEGGPRCNMPGDEPLMMLFDIRDNGAFYVSPETNITPDTIRAFIKEFEAGSLKRMQLQR